MKELVLDTNVLVSGMLRASGPPGRILDFILDGALGIVADDRVISEYVEVLACPRFGFDPREAGAVLALLDNRARRLVPPPLHCRLPDPDDLPFLELAAASGAPLVTGNARHFVPTKGSHSAFVQTPAEFLDALRPEDF